MDTLSHSPSASEHWDAIVIGTGLGGANAGARLVDAGLRVLFIERAPKGIDGEASPAEPVEANISVDGGYVRRLPTSFSAVGGTSVVYAASLERPARHDLDDTAEAPHPTGGWAAGYDQFAPYFDEVARTMNICGTPDPLNPEPAPPLATPPPLCPGDAVLAEHMVKRGNHPYRAHLGISYQPGCKECIGRECLTGCKSDARQPLSRALKSGRAALMSGWTATQVITDQGVATAVVVARPGEEARTIHADRIIIAGGSIASAQLLMQSRSEEWPDGIGNRHDQLGRNLMFHLSERLAIFPGHRAKLGFPAKALATRDSYFRDGMRMGMVQSMGLQADYGNVLMFLRVQYDAGRLRKIRPLRPFLRFPAAAAAIALGNARVLVGILEDLPYAENRVLPGTEPFEAASIAYACHPELHQRRAAFRKNIRELFKGKLMFFLNDDVELNYGHACGTCRFGTDPRTSVLDADCRLHGMKNLYVTDASFMPTSTGVNPGMIIMANSLRVADRILATN